MFSEEDHSYHSHYSEENIYKLAFKNKHLMLVEEYTASVVFISNQMKHVVMWNQKLGTTEDEPVVWDYHAIYVVRTAESVSVIDLDSTLGYRVPFDTYVAETFRPDFVLNNQSQEPLFRVVPAEDYLDHFVSDRSHMIDRSASTASHVVYKQAPPPWPPVIGFKATCETNAESYITMEPNASETFGKVLALAEFMEFGKL